MARRLPAFAFDLETISYPRDGRKELPIKLCRGVAVLELAAAGDSWLDLISLNDEGRVLRRSTVASDLAHRLEPFRVLATMIQIARLLDADEGLRPAPHDDFAAQSAVGHGDLVLSMHLLLAVAGLAGSRVAAADFRARQGNRYGSVSYNLR